MTVAAEIACCKHCGLATVAAATSAATAVSSRRSSPPRAARSEARIKGTLTFSLLLSMMVMMLSLFLFAEDVYGAGGGRGARVDAQALPDRPGVSRRR